MTTSNWNLDTVHSGINFNVRHMVVSKVRGRFGKFTGSVTLEETDRTRSVVEATIAASSIDTGTAQHDDHLRSGDFFDVEHFPQVRFRSTRIEKLGGDHYRLSFDPSEGSLDFLAQGDTTFVLGSAEGHPYDLAFGNYSVHTSGGALLAEETEIPRIGRRLLADGTLQPLT